MNISNLLVKICFSSDGGSVIVKEIVEPGTDETATTSGQFYRNPTFLGVLIGVGSLIVVVIVCLLLVAFRAGHLNVAKIQGMFNKQKSSLFRDLDCGAGEHLSPFVSTRNIFPSRVA